MAKISHLERFPGYHFDDLGGVWSERVRFHRNRTDHGHRLKPTLNNRGYLQVSLMDADGKRKICLVHRLVLEAFKGPAKFGQECCHRDGDRLNNRLTNLRWGSRSENQTDRVLHARARQKACPDSLPKRELDSSALT